MDGGRFWFHTKSAFPPSMEVRSADNARSIYLPRRTQRVKIWRRLGGLANPNNKVQNCARNKMSQELRDEPVNFNNNFQDMLLR